MPSTNAIARAFAQIEAWMKRNAPRLAENLAAGASKATLDSFESALGCALPTDLRLLWSLHDGQIHELNGFYESLDLNSTALARADRSMLDLPLRFLREKAEKDLAVSEMTEDELASNAWIRLAGRGYDAIAVSAKTGRVFTVAKDVPPFMLLAASVEVWIADYAAVVVADGYKVVKGFGDCHLQRRNPEAERREDASRQARATEAKRRAATAPIDLLREAIAKDDDQLATEVLQNAQKDIVLTNELFVLLFAVAEPRFVAKTLRTMLSSLTLRREQWRVVAEGGAQLGNNAVRDIATKKASA